MNIRIAPRGAPGRTDTYGGIVRVTSDGRVLTLEGDPDGAARLALSGVAEIALDDDGGGIE